jgi:TonB-linked SusC/RagA family outer membrane protein
MGRALVAIAWMALAGGAGAQQPGGGGTVSGTVIRANGAAPVEAAQVIVAGTQIGATTDARGHFTITGLTTDTVTLTVRRLGFTSASRTVRVGSRDVQLLVNEAAVHLDEIVTTGTPGAVEQRSLGNSVSIIDAPQTLQQSGAADLGDVLNGRAAGVSISPGTGSVGAGPAIFIRGENTVSLSTQPLLYIDGVRVDNDQGTGPQTQGSNITSRLNDINPEEIESIQIIKGPAAATIYGTEASNGVIQIITKKGAAGKPVFDMQTRQGGQWFPDQTGRIPTNYWLNPTDSKLESFNGAALADASGTPLFRTGDNFGLSGSVAGGTQLVTYRLGTDYDYDNGVDRNNAQRRIAATSNVVYHATPTLDFGSSLYVVHNHVDLGQNYGIGPLWSSLYGSPEFAFLEPATEGYFTAPPVTWNSGVFANTQDLNRFTGTATITNRPADWFNHRLIIGYDQTNENNQGLTTFMPPSVAQFFPGASSYGSNLVQTRNTEYTTLDYAGNFTFPVVSSVKSITSLGAQWYSRHIDSTDVDAEEFPGPGVSAISAAARVLTDGDFVTNNTLGFYGQQQFNWRDRLFLTGAVRVDNNSAFGSNFKWIVYPKVSGSWVISDEGFWGIKAIDKLQLRAAFGESGTQPQNFAALRTYLAGGGPGGNPIATPYSPGNPNLQAERGEEVESGFTASVFNRIGIDFTYYSRVTHNEILSEQLSPSLGFPGLYYFNAGSVYSHGIEVQTTSSIVRSNPIAIDFIANASTAANEITSFGLPPQIPEPSLPITIDQQGLPLNSYMDKKVVSATLSPSGVAENLMCDGGPSVGHRAVPCATAPDVYAGQPIPKFVGSAGFNVTFFRRFQVHTLVDWRTGYQLFDGDNWIRTELGETLASYKPQNYSAVYDADVQNAAGLQYISPWIENADFAKLREISGTYTLPDAWARQVHASHMSLTVGGRNLHTWTSYKGLDPETRTEINDTYVPFNQAVLPLPSMFFSTVNLTF